MPLAEANCCTVCSKPIVWVMGGPGSGKGTQCEKIVDKYGFCYLSTGDLLRAEAKSCSERADQIKEIMEDGELVPNEIILSVLSEAMAQCAEQTTGFLIDGYPREEYQGYEFEKEIGPVTIILYFAAPMETLSKRLLSRARFSGRSDDNEETIMHRLQLFFEHDHAIIEQYADKVCTINGDQAEDDVFADVEKVLDYIMAEHTGVVTTATATTD